MKKEKVINGMYFLETEKYFISASYYRSDVFIKVDEWPEGYYVWPIGRHNFQFEGWLPLCKDSNLKHHVNINTLKAIKVKSEDISLRCLDAAIKGECKNKKDYIKLINLL